mgnify:CR=1 FL=1
MNKENAGLWAGLVIFVTAVVFILYSLQYDFQSDTGPGPGLLPFWLGCALAVLAIIFIIGSIRKPILFRLILPAKRGRKNILMIIGSLLLVICLMPYSGFVIASTIFLWLLLLDGYRWYSSLGIAVGVSLFLFWVFDVLLKIPLPVNAFGW